MAPLTRRRFAQNSAAAIGAATLLSPRASRAQAKPVKIGIMSDMSGPYAEATGPGDWQSRTSTNAIPTSRSIWCPPTCC